MNIKDLSKPLTADQIEFRVQSINNGGYATILAYKDARVDQQRLDEVVGPLNWERKHALNNHNCTVSIWDESKSQWVSKEDTGTPSNTESEKGLASDSFKRACFNWGIGRELYDYPVISVKLKPKEFDKSSGKPRATWALKIREWKWETVFDQGHLILVKAWDQDGNQRFEWASGVSTSATQSEQKWINALKEHLVGGDHEALYDEYFSVDSEFQTNAWHYIESNYRSAIKQALSEEKASRQ